MEQVQPYYKRIILVCNKTRPAGAGKPSCGEADRGAAIVMALKEYVQSHGLAPFVRISQTGCQDLCGGGPIVTIQPDNVVYARVTDEDIPTIIERHIKEFESG
jgi:(2Fe-2S) ferredoxin